MSPVSRQYPWGFQVALPQIMYPIILPPEEFRFAGIDFVLAPESRLAVPRLHEPDPWPWVAGPFTIEWPIPVNFFRRPLSRFFGPAPGELEHHVTGEHVEALLDLARDGNEPMFVELAGCLGVNPGELSTLWQGTRRRLGFKDAPPNVGRAEGDAGQGSPQGAAFP